MARRTSWLWFVALTFALSACAVDTTVTVRVREDGSGVVRVDAVADPEAVRAAEAGGGTLEDRIRLTDLPAAGWRVSPWVRRGDGSASLVVRKRFSRVEEVPAILEELSGPYGPLERASFSRRRSVFATDFAADVVVDLGAARTGVTDDAELVARLQAQGVDVTGVDRQLLTQLRDGLRLRLVVDLPGPGTTTVTVTGDHRRRLRASTSRRDDTRVGLVVAAVVLAVSAAAALVLPIRRSAGPARRVVSSGPGTPPIRRRARRARSARRGR